MDFTNQYSQARELLREGSGKMPKGKDQEIQLFHTPFKSDFSIHLPTDQEQSAHSIFSDSEHAIHQNSEFTLPIIRPEGRTARKKAIILLHGLNERSWDKYMPWAYSLAQQTGKSVILFPIAYHMNRAPEAWKNPREMMPYVSERIKTIEGLHDSSYLNIAISERISLFPQRFFLSGYQAAQDLISLMDELKAGKNPLFDKVTNIDFFAYSIGVMLSQVLLLANPGNRFKRSKFFFFCGGSVLEGMQGESKFILDNQASTRLTSFYTKDLEAESGKAGLFSDLLKNTVLGQSFINLTSFSNLNNIGKKFIQGIQGQVQTVCLKKDKIMPVKNIRKTLKGTKITELDFPYPHTHEVPFSLRPTRVDDLINEAFASVFIRAGKFLCS